MPSKGVVEKMTYLITYYDTYSVEKVGEERVKEIEVYDLDTLGEVINILQKKSLRYIRR